MNKLTIIGNLTKDPELRTTTSGLNVCSFTVAVNRRGRQAEGQPEADYFRVTAWRERADICSKFLQKGKKVCVIGPVSVSTYQAQYGTTRAQLEILADEIEFISPRTESAPAAAEPKLDPETKYEQVDIDDELPF